MKKLFVIAVMAIACLTVSAQEAGSFRFGVTGGGNLSTANLEASHSSKFGFHAGLVAEYNIYEYLYINAMAKYSMRGVKDVAFMEYKLEWNPGYVEVPIHVGYRYSASDELKLFVDAGPYFAYAVSGKIKANDGSDADLFSDTAARVLGGDYKRFEFGLGGAVGVEYSGLQLRIGYDFAFTKICDVSNSAKNSNFYFGLAYMF
jgi:hypothetical protein